MKEEKDSEKSEKILEILRNSRPVLPNGYELTEKVMRQIQKERAAVTLSEFLYELVFGWVYVGWLRRIMIAGAAAIILLFGYQQAVILNKVNALSETKIIETGIVRTHLTGEIPAKIKKYRYFGVKPDDSELKISEKEIDRFIESLNDMQVRYSDIIEMIEKDPGLKSYVEEKLNSRKINKPKILKHE